jgi:hypothetical protein
MRQGPFFLPADYRTGRNIRRLDAVCLNQLGSRPISRALICSARYFE